MFIHILNVSYHIFGIVEIFCKKKRKGFKRVFFLKIKKKMFNLMHDFLLDFDGNYCELEFFNNFQNIYRKSEIATTETF